MAMTYLVSDVHLGAVPRETERAFVAFLDSAAADAAEVVIVGDLFDFWFEYGTIVPGAHFRTLGAIARLTDGGIPVYMVGGNHDAWGGRFLTDEVGVKFSPGELRLPLGGRPALIVHGDGVGSGDFKYRALKATLRSRAAVLGFRLLHPELGQKLARAVSGTEAKAGSPPREGRARYIEDWARSTLRADPGLAYVVCGHAHMPRVAEVEPGRYYLNAGDWLKDFTYITIPPQGPPELKYWLPQ
jgi:UDP-2,3-diacylglucosamine hydrolase